MPSFICVSTFYLVKYFYFLTKILYSTIVVPLRSVSFVATAQLSVAFLKNCMHLPMSVYIYQGCQSKSVIQFECHSSLFVIFEYYSNFYAQITIIYHQYLLNMYLCSTFKYYTLLPIPFW